MGEGGSGFHGVRVHHVQGLGVVVRVIGMGRVVLGWGEAHISGLGEGVGVVCGCHTHTVH